MRENHRTLWPSRYKEESCIRPFKPFLSRVKFKKLSQTDKKDNHFNRSNQRGWYFHFWEFFYGRTYFQDLAVSSVLKSSNSKSTHETGTRNKKKSERPWSYYSNLDVSNIFSKISFFKQGLPHQQLGQLRHKTQVFSWVAALSS